MSNIFIYTLAGIPTKPLFLVCFVVSAFLVIAYPSAFWFLYTTGETDCLNGCVADLFWVIEISYSERSLAPLNILGVLAAIPAVYAYLLEMRGDEEVADIIIGAWFIAAIVAYLIVFPAILSGLEGMSNSNEGDPRRSLDGVGFFGLIGFLIFGLLYYAIFGIMLLGLIRLTSQKLL